MSTLWRLYTEEEEEEEEEKRIRRRRSENYERICLNKRAKAVSYIFFKLYIGCTMK